MLTMGHCDIHVHINGNTSKHKRKERKKERERKTAMSHNGTFVLNLSNIG
jgi:hypothetical protein